MGDALRSQGKDATKLDIKINADSTAWATRCARKARTPPNSTSRSTPTRLHGRRVALARQGRHQTRHQDQRRLDCMGDALRSQGKDATKLDIKINADSTLTLDAPGWPSMKLKSCSSDETVVLV